METNIRDAYASINKENSWASPIANIDWAISRRCNYAGSGKCPWCPNTKLNRLEDEIVMSDELITKICLQLQQANYMGHISLNRYNEPFAIRCLADKIALIRQLLPKNYIGINTNGSLVTAERLKNVYEAGLSGMNFQLYPRNSEEESEFTFEWAKAMAESYCQKLGVNIDHSKTQRIDGYYYEFVVCLPKEWHTPWENPTMVMYAKRLTRLGCDRGGTVETMKCAQRTETCPQVGHFLAIDADGNCSPCTNCTGALLGYKSHEEMILGNVKDTPLSEIFSKVEPMRKALNEDFSEESLEKYPICKHCSFIPHVAQMNRLAEGKF